MLGELRTVSVAVVATLLSITITFSFSSVTSASVPRGWPDGWSVIHEIATTSHSSGAPAVVIDRDDNFHLVFVDRSVTEHWLTYMKLDINGAVLQSHVIYRTRFAISTPQLAIDSENNLHLVWEEHRPGRRKIYYVGFDAHTLSAEPALARRLITTEGNFATYPILTISPGGEIYIFWSDLRTGNWEIFLSKISSTGEMLISEHRITHTSAQSRLPAAAVDREGNMHLVWKEEHVLDELAFVYYVKLDGGTAALDGVPKNLGRTRFARELRGPQLAIAEMSTVYLVWDTVIAESGTREILRLVLTEITTAESLQHGELKFGAGSTVSPSISLNVAHQPVIAWAQSMAGRLYIYYAVVGDAGTLIRAETRLSVEECGGWLPVILVDSGDLLHLFWKDAAGGGRQRLLYMNTVSPVSPSVLARIGLNITSAANLLAQLVFHIVIVIGNVLVFIVLSLPAVILTFLFGIFFKRTTLARRIQANQLLLLSILVSMQLLLLSLIPLGPTMPSFSPIYHVATILLSGVLTTLFIKSNRIDLYQSLPMFASISLWMFWYLLFNIVILPTEVILRL